MPESSPTPVEQLKQLVSQLSGRQRLSLLALAVAVLAPMVWLIVRSEPTEFVPLQWGARFNSETLRQAEQVLIDQGLTEFQTVGESIRVRPELVESYNAALAANGIWSASATDEWQKMFEDVNIFTPREQLKEMRDAHLRRAIRRIVSGIDAIQDADVIWAESSVAGRWNQKKVTCSVVITTRPDHKLAPRLIESLQHAVARMIPNLDTTGIVILDRRTGESWSGGEASIAELRSMAKRQDTIDNLKQRIEQTLRFVPESIVTANIEFAPNVAGSANAVDSDPVMTDVRITVAVPETYLDTIVKTKTAKEKLTSSSNQTPLRQPSPELAALAKTIYSAELLKIKTLCVSLLPAGFDDNSIVVTTYTPRSELEIPNTAVGSVNNLWFSVVPLALLAIAVTVALGWHRSVAAHRETQTLEHSQLSEASAGKSALHESLTLYDSGTAEVEATRRESENSVDASQPDSSLDDYREDDVSVAVGGERHSEDTSNAAIETLDSEGHFDFLSELNPEQIFTLLADEHAQTIAIALSHVSTQMATDVLSSFPEKQQLDIVRRIANSTAVHAEYLPALAESLKDKSLRLDRNLIGHPSVDWQTVSETASESYVGEVSTAARITSIEQLAKLDSTLLAILFRDIPRRQIAIALSGLAHATRSQILLHLPHQTSKEIREYLPETMSSSRPAVQQAQRLLLDTIARTDQLVPKRSNSQEFVA